MRRSWPLPEDAASSNGITETRAKIRAFTGLTVGWHYGEGVPSSYDTRDKALSIQAEAVVAGLLRMDAFPGIDGEIRIAIYLPDKYLEFTVEKNGLITFIEEHKGQETDYQPHLSLQGALAIIHEAGRKLWASFAYSTTGTTIGLSTAFKASRSATHRTIRVSR